ncbi:Rv2175c family DNA-binding protein [Ornithinimicrobium sp. W1679]|uniref:Rv2175c family DNA-binding protein n=1 Tax=unclassified Ornithinimicrobium TaxID=2615080 RepID=UPI003CF15FF6
MVNGIDVIPSDGWLSVPEIMERTGAPLLTVRRWLQDRELIGLRRGPNNAVMVPAGFLGEDGPLPPLRGTITVLADGGMSDEEIVEWLHRPDDTLPGGSPVASLHAGAKTEVRRRAQEDAL